MARKLFGILLALVVALIVIGFLLPTTVHVERSRVIDQPPEVVFDALVDLRHFVQWAPWLERRPEMDRRLEGEEATGVGATLVWRESADAGASRLRIVGVDRPERIDMLLELGDNEAESWFAIADASGGSEVTWGMRIEFGALDLVGRYLGLVLPGLVGNDYREGLEALDDYLARTPGRVPPLPDEDAGGE